MAVGEGAARHFDLIADLAVVMLVAAKRDELQLLLGRLRLDDRRPDAIGARGADLDAIAGASRFNAERLEKAFLLVEIGHGEPELEYRVDAGFRVGEIDLRHAHVLRASLRATSLSACGSSAFDKMSLRCSGRSWRSQRPRTYPQIPAGANTMTPTARAPMTSQYQAP